MVWRYGNTKQIAWKREAQQWEKEGCTTKTLYLCNKDNKCSSCCKKNFILAAKDRTVVQCTQDTSWHEVMAAINEGNKVITSTIEDLNSTLKTATENDAHREETRTSKAALTELTQRLVSSVSILGATKFVEKLLQNTLWSDNFPNRIELQRAHRSTAPRPEPGQLPRF